MKVWQFNYAITSAWHKSDHPGVLLRLEYPGGQLGYADLHPWPELGDPTLDDLLRSLKAREENPFLRRVLQLAAEDAAARSRNVSLFEGLQIPVSHSLIDLNEFTQAKLEARVEQGYRHFKVKLGKNRGRHLTEETLSLKNLAPTDACKWRLDFNGQLDFVTFQKWWEEHHNWLSPHLDGIEDPVRQDDAHCLQRLDAQRLPSTLVFCDRVSFQGAGGVVIKPEVQNRTAPEHARVWITNNLGHPFGHAVALVYASRWQKGEACGLQGLQGYESAPWLRPWCEQIRYHGPVTLPPPGTGFGFDALLPKLAWRKVL